MPCFFILTFSKSSFLSRCLLSGIAIEITPLFMSVVMSMFKHFKSSRVSYFHFALRSRSSRLPYSWNWHHSNAQRPAPCGQRHWRPRLTGTLTVTLGHPDCPAASPAKGLSSSHTRRRRGKCRGEQDTADCRKNLCDYLLFYHSPRPLQMALKSSETLSNNCFN